MQYDGDMTDLHPIAADLEAANRALTRTKATMATQKDHRDQLRRELVAAIRLEIRNHPSKTNVALAAHFGLRSETSIRRIRETMILDDDDE